MLNRRLLAILGMSCLILAFVVSIFMGACAKPAPTPTPTTAPSPAPQKAFNWIFYKDGSTATWYWPYYEAWMGYLREQTNGQLNISVKTSGELPYTGADLGWVTSERRVELGYVWDVEIGGWRDVWETASLPMMFESREQAIACGEQVIKPFLNKVGEKDNIILLQLTTDFPEEIWCKDVVSSVADLNGKKIRAASIADQTVIKELGGVPVSLDYGEVVMAGERGVCDMAITSVASGYADKWYEVYKNLYLWGCSMARECTLINRDAFLELPKEWQDLVVKSAKTMLEDPLNRARDEIVRKAIQDIEAAGGKAVQPTLADRQVLSAAGVKVQKGWTQDEKRSNDAKELYQLILNFKAK